MDVLSLQPFVRIDGWARVLLALGASRGAAVLSHWITASVNQPLEASGRPVGFRKEVLTE